MGSGGNRTHILNASGKGCIVDLGGSGCNGVVIVRAGVYVTSNMGVALTWSDGTSGGEPVVTVAGDRAV
jgi:hypothetical protein